MKTKPDASASATARILAATFVVTLCVIITASVRPWSASGSQSGGTSALSRATEPWTDAQTASPADLVKELSAKTKNPPLVIYVGDRNLYEGAHIPGAICHGPAFDPAGLADLKKWAERIPRSSNLVIYCGCCPLSKCPNIRPAFEALRAMGFRRLRVLLLPDNFYKDWYSKGYPVQKGK